MRIVAWKQLRLPGKNCRVLASLALLRGVLRELLFVLGRCLAITEAYEGACYNLRKEASVWMNLARNYLSPYRP